MLISTLRIIVPILIFLIVIAIYVVVAIFAVNRPYDTSDFNNWQ